MRQKLEVCIFASLTIILISFSTISRITAPVVFDYDIVSAVLQDENGVAKTSFARGHFVMVNATIKNTTSNTYQAEPFLMIASMTTGYAMWGLGAFRYSLLSGGNVSVAPGILIPTNAPTGAYNMTVYVWSNWAHLGGVPLADPLQVKLTVTP